MARKKKGRRGKVNRAIPFAPIAPLAYEVIGAAMASGSIQSKMNSLIANTTGYIPSSGGFNAGAAMPFWAASVAGVVVHKCATKFGINRYVRKATFGMLEL